MVDQELIEAARAGDAGAVRSLLEQGASVDARDTSGATALVAAAYGNHLEAAGLSSPPARTSMRRIRPSRART